MEFKQTLTKIKFKILMMQNVLPKSNTSTQTDAVDLSLLNESNGFYR
jgi:hypothetical protein